MPVLERHRQRDVGLFVVQPRSLRIVAVGASAALHSARLPRATKRSGKLTHAETKTMLFIETLTDFHAKERRRTYRSLKQRLGGRLQHTSEQGEHQRVCPGYELTRPVLWPIPRR